MLSDTQCRRFADDGYLVWPGFKTGAALGALRRRAEAIVAESEPESLTIFSTREQKRHADNYFLSSGDKVRCFFEEEAIGEDGALAVEKSRAVNKIGHAMHERDPVFRDFSADPRLEAIGRALGPANPRALQSMYIFKQPFIGGEVGYHQDSTFLYTEPESVIAFWFAIDDATRENGCLWGIPGGHRGPLRQRMVRAGGGGIDMLILDDTPFEADAAVPLEVEAGTLIAFHGRFPHMSEANRSPRTRHAYTLHVIDGAACYPADNWLQRSDGGDFPAFADLAEEAA